jgi:hypothetical protein
MSCAREDLMKAIYARVAEARVHSPELDLVSVGRFVRSQEQVLLYSKGLASKVWRRGSFTAYPPIVELPLNSHVLASAVNPVL